MAKVRAPRKGRKAALASPDLVEAVVLLRPAADGSVPPAAESKRMAASVLAEAASETGISPAASTVFEHMHSFSVRAPKRFMDAVARAKNVARVMPNEMPGLGLIKPVKKTPVKLPK